MVKQLGRRTNRPAHELTAAVRANESQLLIGAVAAVGALEGADVGGLRVRGQVAIATLAVRSEFQCHVKGDLRG